MDTVPTKKKTYFSSELSRITHLCIPVSDERDQLVVLDLESLIEQLRDEEAIVRLAVDDTATVKLLIR